MAKKRSKKSKREAIHSNCPISSEKVKKRSGRKKKNGSKFNVAPKSTGGHASTSASIPIVGNSSNPPSTNTVSLRDVQGRNPDRVNLEQVSGFIFMCNAETKSECYKYQTFGLPRGQIDIVKNIKQGTMLFLFDTDYKLLYGVYEATTGGDLSLEPMAFNGRFPSQVKFHIYKDCLPLHERHFKHAIRENYHGNKFRQELSISQVKNLVSLFQPVPCGLAASTATSLQDEGMPQILQTCVLEENRPLPTRHPHTRASYLSQSLYLPAIPQLDHETVQLAPHSFAHNQIETHGEYLQPSTGLQYVVQQSAPHDTNTYSPADSHQPYVPDEPLFTSQEPYRRYGVTPQIIQKSQVEGYQSGCHTSVLPREQQTSVQSGYVADNSSQPVPPAVASSHIPLQASSLAQHHAVLPPANLQRELSTLAQYLAPTNAAATTAYADPNQRQGPQTTSLPQANLLPQVSRMLEEIQLLIKTNGGC